MASAASHYREAVRLLEEAKAEEIDGPLPTVLYAEAQVHATLALAGATVLASGPQGGAKAIRDLASGIDREAQE